MTAKILLIHGGGPTAVMNASLYGAVMALKGADVLDIRAARGGLGGILREEWIPLNTLPQSRLHALLRTPGTAIGTSREPIGEEQFSQIALTLKKNGITHVLMNGGNGTMDACGKLAEQCAPMDIAVMGIPKTMDNDLNVTDHCPGYGSAARYMAVSVGEACADVHSLPIHLVIIQALGRNAGWVAAASALAADFSDGPDLICLPERPFLEDAFLSDAQNLIDRRHSGVIVVSEGLRGKNGEPVAPLDMKLGRAEYFGNAADFLSKLVISKLGCKARSESPGILGRASIALQSSVDLNEAILAGKTAAESILRGESGKMVIFVREDGLPYRIRTDTVSLKQVMRTERKMPDAFINAAGSHVTEAFKTWVRPLVGTLPGKMESFYDLF
jgi:6-phosphofructokinase 1